MKFLNSLEPFYLACSYQPISGIVIFSIKLCEKPVILWNMIGHIRKMKISIRMRYYFTLLDRNN